MKRAFLLLPLLVLALVLSVQALDMPGKPTARVNDYAAILSSSEKAALEDRLKSIEGTTSNQIVIAIFPSLEDEDLDDFTNRLFEKWRLGQKKEQNGVLLTLFIQEHKVRIEVGYGLEGALTDATSSDIIRNEMAPAFRQNHYAEGLNAAVNAIDKATRGEYKAKPQTPDAGSYLPMIFFLIFIAFMIYNARRRSNSGIFLPGPGRRGGPPIFFPGGWDNDNRRGGGGFGGFGGGGGGGGGFSGGGGLSGGGGASGSW